MFDLVERDFSPSRTIFGIDEAGRGPLAGPLSMGLVHLTESQLSEIRKGNFLKGLNDSKKLSPKKRNLLRYEIEQNCLFRVAMISHRSIDRFGLSICIYKAILRLIRGFQPSKIFLLIDGNYRFEKYMNQKDKFEYQSIIQGDSRVYSIAAASIIAKEKRDEFMRNLSMRFPEYGFENNMGYGTLQHREAVKKIGFCRYHRLSFFSSGEESPGLFSGH